MSKEKLYTPNTAFKTWLELAEDILAEGGWEGLDGLMDLAIPLAESIVEAAKNSDGGEEI